MNGDPVRASTLSPDAMQAFRTQLAGAGSVVDPDTWAGAVPARSGIAPRVRIGRSRWLNLLWLLPIGFVVLIAAVGFAQELRQVPAVASFIAAHPGSRRRSVALRFQQHVRVEAAVVAGVAGAADLVHH